MVVVIYQVDYQFYMDVAKSIQEVTEEVMLRIARHVHKQTGKKNLCLSGGVALNCSMNGKIAKTGCSDLALELEKVGYNKI